MRGILHHKKGRTLLNTELKHLNNMLMLQMSNRTGLVEKAFLFLRCQSRFEHFDSSLGLEIHMFTQVDLSEPTPSYQADQTIVPKLLTHKFNHLVHSLLAITGSQVPYLGIAKDNFCRLCNVSRKHAYSTRTAGIVTYTSNVVLIHIKVNVTSLCYNRQQIGLTQASFNLWARTLKQYSPSISLR